MWGFVYNYYYYYYKFINKTRYTKTYLIKQLKTEILDGGSNI